MLAKLTQLDTSDLVNSALEKMRNKTCSLNDLVKITDCKHKTPKLVENGIPMVAPGNISWGALQLKGCKQVSNDDFEMLMDHVKVRPMDLVLSRNQTYGIASYVTSNTKFAIGQDTVLLQAKKISPKAVYLFLKDHLIQRQIERACAGSTFKRINLREIRNLSFPIIDDNIERRAIKLFDIFENERKLFVNNVRELCTLRNKLLNNLMSREIVHV